MTNNPPEHGHDPLIQSPQRTRVTVELPATMTAVIGLLSEYAETWPNAIVRGHGDYFEIVKPVGLQLLIDCAWSVVSIWNLDPVDQNLLGEAITALHDAVERTVPDA